MMKLILAFTVVLGCVALATRQHLPDLPNKPAMEFETQSFCPPEGKTSDHGDPELNRHKNRVDNASDYFPVNFIEIRDLDYPKSAGGKDRIEWTTNERKSIEKYEGIPIVMQGYLALVNNAKPGKPKKIEGARPEGKESCNCGSEQPDQIDFHIWLLNSPGDNRKNSVVVEMTPRVRAHHHNWTVPNLTHIANSQFPVRIYGWLMFDGQHPEQVGGTRAT